MQDATQGADTRQTVRHLFVADADELASRIPDWDVELTQLQPGPFSGQLTFVSLGPALICRGKFDQPLLQHVAGPCGCLIVNRPGRGSAPLRHLGHEVEDDESRCHDVDRRCSRALSRHDCPSRRASERGGSASGPRQ